MRLIVARSTQPLKVLGHVSSTLGAEGHVVGVSTRAHGAALAQLSDMVEPEARERVRVFYAFLWFRVMWHGLHMKSVRGPGQTFRYSPMLLSAPSRSPQIRQTASLGTSLRLIQ